MPCPDTEEDIDFQNVQPATPLGLSTNTQEQQIPPVNPGSLEEDEDLDPPTTRSGATFRYPTVPRVNSTQPTVPPVDYSQELEGPNESQYPVRDVSQPASNHCSPAPGSGTCGSEYGSVSGTSSHNDEDQTLKTSQHETRPQQALGTSPTQPPQPGHSSTPNQSLGSAVSRDRAASAQVSPPATQGQLKYPPFVEDAIWTSSNNSMNLPDHTANYSDREWQEYSDCLGAIYIASQE